MNPDSLIKILGFFNKPFHYLIAGIVFLMFAEKDWVIWGWLLIGLSIASFVEWLVNIGKEKFHEKQKKIKEQEKNNIEKEKIYRTYDKLNYSEKLVISWCVNNKNIIYRDDWGEHYEEMLALSVKGFGQLKTNDTFILNPKYSDWLKEYLTVQEDFKKVK